MRSKGLRQVLLVISIALAAVAWGSVLFSDYSNSFERDAEYMRAKFGSTSVPVEGCGCGSQEE